MSETAKLTRGSIRGHLVGQTLPMIFGVAAIMSVGLIDPHVWLCVNATPDGEVVTTRCPVVIGDILVYRDSHHLSNTFVEWFAPILASELVDWFTAQSNLS